MDRLDPYAGYNFRVEIDGLTRAGFKTCSGLELNQNAGTYREGTDPTLGMRKIPGMVSSSDISLGRGITKDRELWDWMQAARGGNVSRRNMSVVLMNDAGKEVVRWNFRNAWPIKWSGPSLDATSDEFAMESLDITHEGIEVDKWS